MTLCARLALLGNETGYGPIAWLKNLLFGTVTRHCHGETETDGRGAQKLADVESWSHVVLLK